MRYIVALDQGTTSSRAVVIDEDGRHDLHILNAFWSFEEYDKGDTHIQKPVIVIMDYEEM